MQGQSSIPLPIPDLPKPSDLFRQEVPREVLAAILRAILQSYRDASSYCYAAMRPHQAKEASGPVRRNKIESEFIGIGERYKRLISVADRWYKRNTGNFVELTSGIVKMTQSCVLTPSDLPREADYRDTLATDSQLSFEFVPKQAPGKYLYAIVLHGVDADSKQRSGCRFAQVRFPLPEFTRYTADIVDLFAMFPMIVAEYTSPTDVDAEEPTAVPLRVIPKIGEA